MTKKAIPWIASSKSSDQKFSKQPEIKVFLTKIIITYNYSYFIQFAHLNQIAPAEGGACTVLSYINEFDLKMQGFVLLAAAEWYQSPKIRQKQIHFSLLHCDLTVF